MYISLLKTNMNEDRITRLCLLMAHLCQKYKNRSVAPVSLRARCLLFVYDA